MQVEQAIFNLLKSNAAVAAFVGARIYPVVMPQNIAAFPALVYRVVTFEDEEILESPGQSTFATWRIRVISVGKGEDSYPQVKRLDRAVRTALQGFVGTVTDDISHESIVIQCIFTDTIFDLAYDDKTETQQTATDFDVTAEEQS